MVLFCHAIATANMEDLKCLGDFVSSLQTSGESVEAAEKLWRLCHVFHRVAELYIEAKVRQHHHSDNTNSSHQLGGMHQPSNISSPATSTTLNASDAALRDNSNNNNNPTNTFRYDPPFPIDDFEPYLSALGFPNAAGFLNIGTQQPQAGLVPQTVAAPGEGGPATEYNPTGPATLEAGLGAGDANSLENWFTGNVNIMSLLEMDLSSIIK